MTERPNPEQLYTQLVEGQYADIVTNLYHEVLQGAEDRMYFPPTSLYQTSRFLETTLQPVFITPLSGQTLGLTGENPLENILVIFSQDKSKKIIGHNSVPLIRDAWGNLEAHEDIATRIRGKGIQGGLDLATLLHLQLLAFNKNETIYWTINNANQRTLTMVKDILTQPGDQEVIKIIEKEQDRWQTMYYKKLGFDKKTNVRRVAAMYNFSRWASPNISEATLVTPDREQYNPIWNNIKIDDPKEIQAQKKEYYQQVILPEILQLVNG